MNAIKFGKFLTKIRKEKGITQQELADMLHEDKRKISRWECGNNFPEFDVLIKLGKIFDVTLYEFSVGERIKDKTILELAKDRLKGIAVFQIFKWSKKLLIILAILFGIFLGLSAIYTIKNYDTVHVYKFRSLNNDFYINGNYIITKNDQLFNLNDVGYLGKSDDILSQEVKQLEYDITIGTQRFTDINNTKITFNNKQYFLFNDSLSYLKLSNVQPMIEANDKQILTLNIKCFNKNNKQSTLSFNFKLDEISNNLFL